LSAFRASTATTFSFLDLHTCSNTGNYSNYLDALMAVYDDAQARGIPYKAVLLDVSRGVESRC
jgi:hypothetical protein